MLTTNANQPWRPRSLTRNEVAWIMEQRTEGVSLNYMARYVYGISGKALYSRLKTWEAV